MRAGSLRPLRLVWLGLVTVAAGCGGGPTGPGTPFAPFDFAFSDPQGDTLPPGPGLPDEAPAAIDVVAVRGRVEQDRIVLTLEFAGPVAPWSAGASNSLDGFVDFDLDQSSTTGIPGAGTAVGSVPGLGVEFYLDLRDPRSGKVALVEPAGRRFALVSARFGGPTVTIEIPRRELGSDDGQFRMGLVVGVPGRPITDVAPNTGNYTVVRPVE